MSRQAMETIKAAEERAREIIEQAQSDAEAAFAAAEEEISRQRSAFYERLKAERKERLRRSDMQLRLAENEAKNAAQNAFKEAEERYAPQKEHAVSAAIKIISR